MLDGYARAVGLAFQIIDDVLDIVESSAELGKTAGKDIQHHKATYPAVWGIDESRRKARELVDEADFQHCGIRGMCSASAPDRGVHLRAAPLKKTQDSRLRTPRTRAGCAAA